MIVLARLKKILALEGWTGGLEGVLSVGNEEFGLLGIRGWRVGLLRRSEFRLFEK